MKVSDPGVCIPFAYNSSVCRERGMLFSRVKEGGKEGTERKNNSPFPPLFTFIIS